LGVRRDATFEEIKNAFRRLSIKFNPKTNKDKDAEQRFIEVTDAYNHLSNEFRRREYDQYIFGELLPIVSHSIFSDFFNER
jgi:DnaJ-class molecular chaperone